MEKRHVPLDDYAQIQWAKLQAAREAQREAFRTIEKARGALGDFFERAHADIGTIDGKPVCRYNVTDTLRIDVTRLKTERPYIAHEFGKRVIVRSINEVKPTADDE